MLTAWTILIVLAFKPLVALLIASRHRIHSNANKADNIVQTSKNDCGCGHLRQSQLYCALESPDLPDAAQALQRL